MVSVEIVQTREVITRSVINEEPTSPRISFSTNDFLDERNFISATPQSQQQQQHSHHHHHHHHQDHQKEVQGKEKLQENNGGGRNTNTAADFEFLSITNGVSSHKMLTADELFFEGKLLPFWQIPHSIEKLHKISFNNKHREDEEEEEKAATAISSRSSSNSSSNNNNNREAAASETRRVSWFVDDDPSPRPPKCTVLWKELLKLKKQRASSSSSSSSSLSPSSSSSSTSSSSSSLSDFVTKDEGKEGCGNRDNKHFKRIKKGLERRTRSMSIMRIRPIVNVPIYTQQVKSSAIFPPRFSSHERKIIREVK